MADRLQKTLAVPTAISSKGNPVGPDTTTAQAISAAGSFAGEQIKVARKEELQNELQTLGQEAFAAKQGRELEVTTDRFKRLQAAKEQGAVSDTFLKIEAEKVLKEVIDKNPGFAPELRQSAASILGFDPTGSEIKSLFQLGAGKAEKTATDKMMDQARALAAGNSGLTEETAFQLIQKAQIGKLQAEAVTNNATIGKASADQVFSTFSGNADAFVTSAIQDVNQQVAENGGVKTPEMYLGALTKQKQALMADFRTSITQSGITLAPDKLREYQSQLDAQFADIEELAAEGTFDKILQRQTNSVGNAVALTGFEFYGDLAAINKAAGGAATAEYVKALSNLSNPKMFELLKSQSPGLARISKDPAALQTALSARMQNIMGVGGKAPATQEEAQLEDVVRRTMINTTATPETRDQILRSTVNRGQMFKDFGDYAQAGVRAKSTPQEVTYVSNNFKSNLDPLIGRIASQLEQIPEFSLGVKNGVLEVVPSRSDLLTGAAQGSSINISPSITDEVKRLNAMNKLLQNGWSQDVGENSFGFLERTIGKVETLRSDAQGEGNDQSLSEAMAAYDTSPTAANLDILRRLDPELVREAEARAAAQGGSNAEQ